MSATLTKRLADYAIDLKYENLPAPMVCEVKRRLIDSFGCAFETWNAPACVIARQAALQYPSNGGAQLWGTNQRVATDWAAFANSFLVPNHNNPALFAVAEAEQSSGRELIAAIAVAHEIQRQVTNSALPIVAGAGKLMGLNAESLGQALGFAGVSIHQPPMNSAAFAIAARNAVFAALIVRDGLTGPAPQFADEIDIEKLVHGQLVAGPSPLTDVQVEEKFLAQANHHLTRDQVESLLHQLWRLDEMTDISQLLSLTEVVV